MATDGVKIIDGDTAYDVYALFMDAYNEGSDIVRLREMYEQDKVQYSFDDCEYEICITVYALAFWEIGELTPEILKEVETVIAKGAGVADWAEQVDEKAGIARQKELDKFLKKISVPNTKIRTRKKYAKVKHLIFNIGDVLAFRMPDGKYGLTIIVDIIQYHGECEYMFCRTTFNSNEKPTIESIADLHIYCSLVPTGGHGMDSEMLVKMSSFSSEEIANGALNRLMDEYIANMSKLKMPWVNTVFHKKLKEKGYFDNFEKLGNVELRSNCGSGQFAQDYNSFCKGFYAKKRELESDNQMRPESGEFTVKELQQQPYMP